jgi:hypothetical protein
MFKMKKECDQEELIYKRLSHSTIEIKALAPNNEVGVNHQLIHKLDKLIMLINISHLIPYKKDLKTLTHIQRMELSKNYLNKSKNQIFQTLLKLTKKMKPNTRNFLLKIKVQDNQYKNKAEQRNSNNKKEEDSLMRMRKIL